MSNGSMSRPVVVLPRRAVLVICVAGCLLVLFVLTTVGGFDGNTTPSLKTRVGASSNQIGLKDKNILSGHAIAPKLGNETAKAELGRAAWKLFHTTFARFPDEPTEEESEALRSYIHLFQRLYPCGECASHFGEILDKFPPQVASRSTAAAWGCHVHNQVNKSLRKKLFDCSNIGDFYDCGCAEDEDNSNTKTHVS